MTTGSTIELRVDNMAQLFDRMDPFPFRERDLDSKAEAYIVGWARDFPERAALNIVIHVPSVAAKAPDASHIEEAFQRHFRYCAERTAQDLRELFRRGRYAIAVGASVLIVAMLIRHLLINEFVFVPGSRFLEESLLIMSWVANWRPMEIFLYAWWPLVRTRRLYRRLAITPVFLRAFD